jgi:prepilin-type N-terminal cleavage/methylation domain-containing protein
MQRKSHQGFTLVEIAIVLVIVGLLLGGVLKGQELITSARVRNLADQSAGIQAAYYGFVDRFRQVPGDWPATLAAQAIPGVGTGGNGNGRLDRARTEWTESLALWEHLSRAGFMQGQYAGGDEAPGTAGNTAPRNAFNGFMLLSRSSDYLAGTRHSGRHPARARSQDRRWLAAVWCRASRPNGRCHVRRIGGIRGELRGHQPDASHLEHRGPRGRLQCSASLLTAAQVGVLRRRVTGAYRDSGSMPARFTRRDWRYGRPRHL